mgnify:CR=1 FL=1
MSNTKRKKYKYYACYKKGNNGGVILEGRYTCKEAFMDLKNLTSFVSNDLTFIGVLKTDDCNPFKRIVDLN